jgi:transcription initiation factor TFIID subunit TAF12
MKMCRTLALSLAALLTIAQAASAQDWQQRRRDRPQQQQQQPQQQQVPQQQFAPGGGGGACSPSGFARLSRNCSVNTGGCQRMPETCNRGWCCP